jgi:hypothetical protein
MSQLLAQKGISSEGLKNRNPHLPRLLDSEC